MSRRCAIVVLPEDQHHAALARGDFQGRNVHERAYDISKHWFGKNGNEAAVRKWLIKEVRRQKTSGSRFGILAFLDGDLKGLEGRTRQVNDQLQLAGLPRLDSKEGRCLVVPVRNVETWMVWAARWAAAGSSGSPSGPPPYAAVSESVDFKRGRGVGGEPIEKPQMSRPFDVGKVLATLNSEAPPAGIPDAMQRALRELNEFLNWTRI